MWRGREAGSRQTTDRHRYTHTGNQNLDEQFEVLKQRPWKVLLMGLFLMAC